MIDVVSLKAKKTFPGSIGISASCREISSLVSNGMINCSIRDLTNDYSF